MSGMSSIETLTGHCSVPANRQARKPSTAGSKPTKAQAAAAAAAAKAASIPVDQDSLKTHVAPLREYPAGDDEWSQVVAFDVAQHQQEQKALKQREAEQKKQLMSYYTEQQKLAQQQREAVKQQRAEEAARLVAEQAKLQREEAELKEKEKQQRLGTRGWIDEQLKFVHSKVIERACVDMLEHVCVECMRRSTCSMSEVFCLLIMLSQKQRALDSKKADEDAMVARLLAEQEQEQREKEQKRQAMKAEMNRVKQANEQAEKAKVLQKKKVRLRSCC